MSNFTDFIRGIAPLERSSLANPATWLTDFITGGTTSAGVVVNKNTAITLPAVYSSITLWGGIMASMPIDVFNKVEGGKESLRTHPASKLLRVQPNQYMNAFEFRRLIMVHAQLAGNFYSLIVHDGGGKPKELIPLRPSQVQPILVDKKIWYVIDLEKEGRITVDSSMMIHIKNWGFDGIVGKSFVSVLRENLGIGLASQKTTATFMRKGMKLDGVITNPGKLDEKVLKNLRSSWRKTYEGTEGERVAILDGGFDYKSISMSAQDAQFLETRKFSVTDIARATRVPPPLLFELDASTYNNIANLIQAFSKFDIMPWAVNIESELFTKLLTEDEKNSGNTFFEHNMEGLLRGAPLERANFYSKLFPLGAIDSNEIRNKENMNSYDTGGEKYVPMNMRPTTAPFESDKAAQASSNNNNNNNDGNE